MKQMKWIEIEREIHHPYGEHHNLSHKVSQFLVERTFTDLDECYHDGNIYLDSALAIENTAKRTLELSKRLPELYVRANHEEKVQIL